MPFVPTLFAMTETYFLQSRRLGFRTWRDEDLPIASELWCNPDVTHFFGVSYDAEGAAARLTRELNLQREHGIQYWPMFLLSDGRHVGCAGLRPYRDGVPELGYHLRPEFWGQGMGLEAAEAVARYGFESLGYEQLFAGHHPDHHISRKILLKIGFQYIGDEVYPVNGMLEPAYLLRKSAFRR